MHTFFSQNITEYPVTQSVPSKLWNVPPQNPYFTGRNHLLEKLTQYLSIIQGKSQPVVLSACYGLGGVGKTQIAIEYVHRQKESYEHVCWLSAESKDTLEMNYLILARQLGLVTEKMPQEEAILFFKIWLSQHPKVLLVLDNAPDFKTIAPYLPTIGAKVLITSRYTQWPQEQYALNVVVFSEEEALKFLEKILGLQTHSVENKKELAKQMGYLPLALAQAAAYIQQTKITIFEYLELYQTCKVEILNDKTLPVQDEHVPVYVTWNVTLSEIEKQCPTSVEWISLCACLHHEDIPYPLLLNLLAEIGGLEFNKASEIITAYSLMQKNQEKKTFSMHNVLQEIILLQLQNQKMFFLSENNNNITFLKIVEKIIKILSKSYDCDLAKIEPLYKSEKLFIHVAIVLRHAIQLKMQDSTFMMLVFRTTEYSLATDRLQGAKHILANYKLMLTKSYLEPKNHLQLHANYLRKLSTLLNVMRAEEEQYRTLFKEMELFLEENINKIEKKEVAKLLFSLGVLLQQQEKVDLNLSLVKFEEAMKIAIEIGEHELQLACVGSIGSIKKAQEKYQEALIFFEKAIHLHEKWERRSSNHIAHIYNELGWMFWNTNYVGKNYGQAKKYYWLTIQECENLPNTSKVDRYAGWAHYGLARIACLEKDASKAQYHKSMFDTHISNIYAKLPEKILEYKDVLEQELNLLDIKTVSTACGFQGVS